MLVTKNELAGLLGISDGMVGVYIKAGMGGKSGQGAGTRYDVKSAIEHHVTHKVGLAIQDMRQTDSEDDDVADLETSKRHHAHWKAEQAKTETLALQGELIPLADAEREITHKLTQVRAVLDAMPGELAKVVVGMSTEKEARDLLTVELQRMYETLSSLPDLVDVGTDGNGSETDDD